MVYQNFEEIFVRVLDAHAPRKTEVLCGNHKPHVDKNLCKSSVLNKARLYMQVLPRVPNMSDYGSICLNNA